MKLRKILSLIICAFLLLSCLFSLISCTSEEQNANAEAVASDVVMAMVEGDFNRAYKYFSNDISVSDFRDFFDKASLYFADIGEYTMTPVGWQVNVNNGVSTYTVTFRIAGERKSVMLAATFLSESDAMTHLNIVPATTYFSDDIIPWQIILVLFSLLVIAFIVWMIVDCAKSSIKNKLIYVILILAGVHISCAFGTSFDLSFKVILLEHISYIMTNGIATSVNVSLPVGAVIYFFLRKRLKASAVSHSPDPVETDFVDVTDSLGDADRDIS